jgi:uncharacterized protein YbjQ (UPF0145 family)
MNKLLLTTLFLTLAQPALARDDHLMLPLKDALETSAAQSKLDKNIQLVFGKQAQAKVEKSMGEWKTNKKTNAFNKSDKEACEWAFLSAVLELQERAQKEGGNAVVDIKSNYKSIERTSEDQYMCGAGGVMAGVALKGTVVKLAK